jgi:hypothetical protein
MVDIWSLYNEHEWVNGCVLRDRDGGGGECLTSWGMGGSIWGGVAVYDGHNGIMAFGTNLLGPRSVPSTELLYRFVCMKPFN